MGCNACENRKMMKAQDPEGWRDMEMGPVECEKHRGEVMPTDDVLERADRWATGELHGNEANRLILDLSSSLRSARERIAELERDRDFAKSGVDRLQKRLDAAKDGTDKAIELIQRWGCECEPRIGFLCGPCRAVELIDAAMAAERGGE